MWHPVGPIFKSILLQGISYMHLQWLCENRIVRRMTVSISCVDFDYCISDAPKPRTFVDRKSSTIRFDTLPVRMSHIHSISVTSTKVIGYAGIFRLISRAEIF